MVITSRMLAVHFIPLLVYVGTFLGRSSSLESQSFLIYIYIIL